MLDRFDWLRRSRTGAEFLATLRCFQAMPELFTGGGEFGPPFSALNGPCWRCWVYPRGGTSPRTGYCPICQAILDGAGEYGITSRYAAVIWGYVNRLPRSARAGSGTLGAYICDERHFLVAMVQQELKPWLQELLLYDGEELKGLLQVFPTVGLKEPSMGELLAHIVHREARFPPDRLRVSFFPALRQVFHSRTYEKEGVLTFEATEFLNTLELATVFPVLPDCGCVRGSGPRSADVVA
jgi:hypothetical protein